MLSKMFVKARIEKKNNVYIVVATYSYYYMYHYDEMGVYATLNEAEKSLLNIRCSGLLVYHIGDEK